MSSSLEGVSPRLPFFSNPALSRLLFLSRPRALSAAKKKALERCSEIIPVSPSRAIAPQIVAELAKRGHRLLLVEGGGGVMWDFASENLIDEYHVTLTPKIVGGRDAPTLVDGAGFLPSQALQLKLVRARRIGDELFLTYRK